MTRGELKAELALLISDDSLDVYFDTWIYDAVMKIAADFELPGLKLYEPNTLTTTTSDWLYDMPATDPVFHKKCFKCRNENGDKLTILNTIAVIEELDYDHDETGDNVTNIAVEYNKIAIFPKANDVLSLWYYKKPQDVTDDNGEFTCILPEFHETVLLPKVVLRGFEKIEDMAINPPHKGILYWKDKYREGLYGTKGGDIGFIHFLAKLKGVRKYGGHNPLP